LFALALAFTLVISGPISAFAATTPPLGIASTFSILSSTYTNTAAGTTVGGDLGYTTAPAVMPTVNGIKHVVDATYNQAGIDQATALTNLNNQPATFTFAPGAIDLASDATHGTVGVYTPGVYSITGAADIGGGGTITLNGAGTYIFRMTGALNTSAGSVVAYANGASPCDVFWTPGAATTLGANSTFVGTDIDASGITIGRAVTWTGRALAFGGTITTDVDTIATIDCTAIEAAAVATAEATRKATADAATAKAAEDAATAKAAADAAAAAAAKLPNTGVPHGNGIPWNIIIVSGILVLASTSIIVIIRKRKITI
jgi:hypothetical protein